MRNRLMPGAINSAWVIWNNKHLGNEYCSLFKKRRRADCDQNHGCCRNWAVDVFLGDSFP